MDIHIYPDGTVTFKPASSADELIVAGVLAVLHKGGTLICDPNGGKTLTLKQVSLPTIHPDAEKALTDYTDCLLKEITDDAD